MIGRRYSPPAPQPKVWPVSELLLAGAVGVISTLALARLATQGASRMTVFEHGLDFAAAHPAPAALLGIIWELADA